jgi:hypothetical protein
MQHRRAHGRSELLTYVQSGAEVFKSVHPHRLDLTSDVANLVHRECRPHADELNRADGADTPHGSDGSEGER